VKSPYYDSHTAIFLSFATLEEVKLDIQLFLRLTRLTVLVFGGLLVKTWPRLRRFLRFSNSSNWPVVRATVEEATVQLWDGASTYRAEVVYSYEIGGEYYSGRYTSDSPSEKEANAVISEHPKGLTLWVHVNPANPELSDLIP
jgi:hypothetical protein